MKNKKFLGVIAMSCVLGLTGAAHADGGPFGGTNDCENPADVNADGLLDIQDVISFVQAVVSQDDAADINGDGIFDLADVQLFVDSFLAGCP